MATERIELELHGSRTSEGSVEFDALLTFGDAFRRALRAAVRARSGLPPVQPGQPAADVREASSFRLVALRKGSAILELEPVEPRLVADPAVQAAQTLADGVADRSMEVPVVELLREAVQSLGVGGRVGMRVPGRDQIEFDVARLNAIAPPSSVEIEAREGTVDGWLHAVDIDPDEIRIRDTGGRDWSCHYPEELETQVRELIGEVVRATGSIRAIGARPRIEVASLEALELPEGFIEGRPVPAERVLGEAMAEAGVTAPQPLTSLAATVAPDDAEEQAFEDALRAIR